MNNLFEVFLQQQNAKELSVEQAPHFHATLEALAKKAETTKPKLYLAPYLEMHGKKIHVNAAALGSDCIVVTQGLLDGFGCSDVAGKMDARLEAVLGHELYHNKGFVEQVTGKLAPILIAPAIAVTGYEMWKKSLEKSGVSEQHRSIHEQTETMKAAHPFDFQHKIIESAKLSALAIAGVAAGGAMGMKSSRYHEFKADAFSKKLTGSGEHLIDALDLLQQLTAAEMKRNTQADEHAISRWIKAVYASHPPVAERIAALR